LRYEIKDIAPVLSGLKCAAVAVVAQAVLSMGASFCRDFPRLLIAAAVCALVLVFRDPVVSFSALLTSGALGILTLKNNQTSETVSSTRSCVSTFAGRLALAGFIVLIILVSVGSYFRLSSPVDLFRNMYMAGSFVIGGGHVVLPLLESRFVGPGGMDHETFLAGYGAAQALPGPLFTFACYVGAMSLAGSPILGSALGLASIFLPGILLFMAVFPRWARLYEKPWLLKAVMGACAGVVGLMAGAWIDPIASQALRGVDDVLISVLVFVLLRVKKLPIWLIVILSGCLGAWMK